MAKTVPEGIIVSFERGTHREEILLGRGAARTLAVRLIEELH